MASLFNIDERLRNYEMQFDPDTGEWVNEDEFNAISMEKSEKIENTLLVIKEKLHFLDALKAEKKGREEEISRVNKEVETLKARVGASLNYEKFESARAKASFRKSESVVIKDADKIPAEFMEYKNVASPKKDAIKRYLKGIEGSDEKCEWAEIETKQNLQLK